MNKFDWTISAITDRGLQRKDNQDNFYVSPDKKFFVVADGMGGAAHGAEASRLAVEAVQNKWEAAPPNVENEEETRAWLHAAVVEANHNVMTIEGANEEHGPGTTIVAAVQSDDGVLSIAHVGDSRAYLCRGAAAEVLTKDHSFVMEMQQNNQLTEEQAWTNPYRNLLTRCLGHDRNVGIELSRAQLQPGDWALLCSDGLSGVLRNGEIAAIVAGCELPEELCGRLVEAVLGENAPDNVTIVALRIEAKASDEIAERPAATNGVH